MNKYGQSVKNCEVKLCVSVQSWEQFNDTAPLFIFMLLFTSAYLYLQELRREYLKIQIMCEQLEGNEVCGRYLEVFIRNCCLTALFLVCPLIQNYISNRVVMGCERNNIKLPKSMT